MSIAVRGTDALKRVKESLQENFQTAFLLSKGPPLASETREDSPKAGRPSIGLRESDKRDQRARSLRLTVTLSP